MLIRSPTGQVHRLPINTIPSATDHIPIIILFKRIQAWVTDVLTVLDGMPLSRSLLNRIQSTTEEERGGPVATSATPGPAATWPAATSDDGQAHPRSHPPPPPSLPSVPRHFACSAPETARPPTQAAPVSCSRPPPRPHARAPAYRAACPAAAAAAWRT